MIRRLAALVSALLVLAAPVWAGKQAFVLANAQYENLSDLRNTHADARAYAQVLADLEFEVAFHTDLTLDDTEEAFEAFLDRLSPGDEVVFVYSGHGWSDGGTNYLIPVDAPKQGRDRRLKRNSLPLRNGLNGVMDAFEAAGASLTVAIIDACRNNPFDPTPGTKSVGLRRGLAPVKAATGTFVIYSAGEGQEALDRLPDDPPDEKLSVFTRSFIPHLRSGVSLERAISKAQVETAALAQKVQGHQQHPAYYDQTLGDTCLAGVCAAAVQVDPCDALYSEAKQAAACYAYDAYLRQCTSHVFAPLAEGYMRQHCQQKSEPEPETAASEDTTAPSEDAPASAPSEPPQKSDPLPHDRDRVLALWAGDAPIKSWVGGLTYDPSGQVAMSRDGRFVLAYDGERDFAVFSADHRPAPQFIAWDKAPKDADVIWSPVGYMIVRRDGEVTVHEPETDRILARYNLGEVSQTTVWSDAGASRAVVMFRDEDRKARIAVVNLGSGVMTRAKTVLSGRSGTLRLSVSADGNQIVAYSDLGRALSWNLLDGTETLIDMKPRLGERVLALLRISHNNSRLFVDAGLGDHGQIFVFDSASGEFELSFANPSGMFLSDKGFLDTADHPLRRLFFDWTSFGLFEDASLSVVYRKDLPSRSYKDLFAVAEEAGLLAHWRANKKLDIYDMRDGALLRGGIETHLPGLADLRFRDGGREIVLVSQDGAMRGLSVANP